MPATLVLVRIDDRLIHGQVAVGWVKATTPEVIVVANDAVAADALQRNLMELATPQSLQVAICRVEEAVGLCQGPRLAGKRVLVLFATPQDVLRAVTAGLKLARLNVGGMRFKPGKRQVLKAVSLDEEDVKTFRALQAQGIQVTVQMVPTDEPVEIEKVLAAMKASSE
jgi:mannose/fructose/sorbose-specific phosphotransferase system IIB component